MAKKQEPPRDMARIYNVACCVMQVVQWMGEKYPGLILELSPGVTSFGGPELTIRDKWDNYGKNHVIKTDPSWVASVSLGMLRDDHENVIKRFEDALKERQKRVRSKERKAN